VITSVAISPDGKLLAVAGYHEVLLHNLERLAPPLTVALTQGSGDVPKTTAAAQGTGNPESIERPQGKQNAQDNGAASAQIVTDSIPVARLIGLSERVQSLAFSPDGKLLAAIGGSPARMGEVQIWDVATHKLVRSQNVTFDTLYGAAFSPDGMLLAFGGADNTLRAIEVKTGKQVFYQMTHTDWVMDCVFSVKGSHLVSVSRDFSMKLNDVPTQRFIDNITSITPGALKGGLHAVDRHPQRDELLIGGSDGVPKIYRMIREKARKIGDDFNLIRQFGSLPGRIYAVAYSPDGTLIAAGSSSDGAGEVRTFEEANGKPTATMKGITGGIYTVAFLPDGQRLASAGFSGTVYIHEARTGKLLAQFVPVPMK
jgi:WD40 repeat protein